MMLLLLSGKGRDLLAALGELERLFRSANIDFARPGFYDQPGFVMAERRDPRALEAYAEYIDKRPYPEDYKARARAVVTRAAQFLSRELEIDGRRGACIDASGALMRMLEREGIWSYMAGGATVVEFPRHAHLRAQYFHPFVHPDNPAKTGHMWLRVPPFAVVDVTLAMQPWSNRQRPFIPAYIASEAFNVAEKEIDDLIEDELMELLMEQGRVPTMANLEPRQRQTMEKFPAFQIEQQELRIKYVPTRVSAMDGALEDMRNLCLSGKYPAQLYQDFRAVLEAE